MQSSLDVDGATRSYQCPSGCCRWIWYDARGDERRGSGTRGSGICASSLPLHDTLLEASEHAHTHPKADLDAEPFPRTGTFEHHSRNAWSTISPARNWSFHEFCHRHCLREHLQARLCSCFGPMAIFCHKSSAKGFSAPFSTMFGRNLRGICEYRKNPWNGWARTVLSLCPHLSNGLDPDRLSYVHQAKQKRTLS